MFLKNNFRHAFAFAGSDGQTTKNNRARDAFMFDEAEEVADFGSTGSSAKGNGNPAPKKNGGFNAKPVVIAVVAFIAVILLVVAVVAIVSSISKDIKCEDNSFIAYEDHDGVARVAANGKFVDEYEGEIQLIVADDRSFAYVIETTEDGQMLYLINAKGEQEPLTLEPVTKVLDTASIKPGAIWYEGNDGVDRVWHYTEKNGPSTMLTKASRSSLVANEAHSFVISGDGETVIFYKTGDDGKDKLMKYNDHQTTPVVHKSNHYPVAVSDNGEIVYVKTMDKDGIIALHAAVPDKNGEYSTFPVAKKFGRMLAMNKDGDEIVYTTIGEELTESTFVVNIENIDTEDELASKNVGRNWAYTPVDPKGEVARFDTFEECFFQAESNSVYELMGRAPSNYLFYFDSYKEASAQAISKTEGKFSPNGKYYFTINAKGTLVYYSLTDKSNMSSSERISASDGEVADYAVTQKGNVYWLSDSGTLMYYNMSKAKSTRIHTTADNISMHTATNVLYFTTDGTNTVFSTKEGSKHEKADLGSVNATSILAFADANSKATFAGYYDADNDEYVLIYTSNGKRFKQVGKCMSISGLEFKESIPEFNLPDVGTTDSSETAGTTDTSEN